LRVVNINLATALPAEEAIQFLRDRPETKTSALLNEKLGDILKSKGKWVDAVGPYQLALKLNPTPLQRVKITFTLANMQNNLGRSREAYELYQGLLRDYPNFPDLLQIYRKILPLAEQHGKPGEAAEYSRAIKALAPKT
jgi:tetratricopeptide (TPR) repeat protein